MVGLRTRNSQQQRGQKTRQQRQKTQKSSPRGKAKQQNKKRKAKARPTSKRKVMDDKTQRAERDARGERRSRTRVEAVRDREAMRWIARFRFVTTDGLAARFGVSERAMRTRVVRLERGGLVRLDRNHRQPTSISLSRRGYQEVGLPPRNSPRVDAQRDHELAIVRQVAYFESRADARVEILTSANAAGSRARASARFTSASSAKRLRAARAASAGRTS